MEPLYHGMDRSELDDAYKLAKDADLKVMLSGFLKRSEAAYRHAGCQRNIHYASGQRNTLDYFPSTRASAPTLIFIHGGFWQSTTKEHYAFITEGLLAHYQVILAEYTLAPEASMSQIYAETGAMLNFLHASMQRFQLQPGKICLCGHSAGAHLAALHRSHPLISHEMWLSGIVDLTPIALCYLNENLRLTPGEIRLFSPANSISNGVPAAVHVGADERSEMLNHSDRYAQLLAQAGNTMRYTRLAGCDHFTLLNEFAESGVLTASLHQLFAAHPTGCSHRQ